MRKLSLLSFGYVVILTLCSLLPGISSAAAQEKNWLDSIKFPLKNSIDAAVDQRVKGLPFFRSADATVRNLLLEYNEAGKIDSSKLFAILSDEEYLRSLSAEEAGDLAWVARYADCNASSYYGKKILEKVFSQLGTYKEKTGDADKDFILHSFFEVTAVSLGHNPDIQWGLFNQAYDIMSRCISNNRTDCGWVAVLLSDLPTLDEEGISAGNAYYERHMKLLIMELDRKLSYHASEETAFGKKVPNQAVMLQLVAQSNSFFAAKDDDSWYKAFVTTGFFNSLFSSSRFSDTGEVFYFHPRTPGSDGNGNFADTENGRLHFILSELIAGLFSSYHHIHSVKESSELMQKFLREAIELNKKDFVHYLYTAHQGISIASQFHFASSLDGWENEAAALHKQMYSNLKKGYPELVAGTCVQGICEVALEWVVMGEILKLGGKAIGAIARTTSNQVVKHLSARSLMRLAVADLAVRQGGKTVLRWTRQGCRAVLKKAGWKSRPVRAH